MQGPHLFLEFRFCDFSYSVRLLHIRSQLGEDLIKGNAYADGQSELFFRALSDLFSDFHWGALHAAASDIQPTLIHTERFHLIRVTLVDGTGQLAVF